MNPRPSEPPGLSRRTDTPSAVVSAARLLLAFAICLLAPSAHAQEQHVVLEGTQAFVQIMNFFGLRPLSDIAALSNAAPNETLIVVFGETSALGAIGRQVGSLKRFVEAGGALLVATDRPTVRLREFGVEVSGQQVYQGADQAYKRQPHYPLIKPTRAHPIFADVSELATNSPSYLSYQPFAPESMAEFSVGCYLVDDTPVVAGTPFMIGLPGWNNNERLLILAGHSVFMNGMLGQPDNDNFIFTYNCIRWLRESPAGRPRKHVLFVEDNAVAGKLDVPLALPSPPPMPPVTAVNRLLQKLEEENFFHRLFYGDGNWDGLLNPQLVLRSIILLLSLALLICSAARLAGSVARTDTAVPLPQAWNQQRMREPAVVVQRDRELQRLNNYSETAHYLACQFFEQYPDAASRLDAGWWTRRRLRKNIRHLQDLASGVPVHVSAAGLKRLLRQLDELAVHLST